MGNATDNSVTAVSRASCRSSRGNSLIRAHSSNSSSTNPAASFRASWPRLSPPSLSETCREQRCASPPPANLFLLPRAPSALCQSEPGSSTSPRVDGAALRQKEGPTEFQSPAGPQFSEFPIKSYLRAKYGGKIPGADGRRFPAACSVGLVPTTQESQQLVNAFCFENALRGACSPTCPVDGVQASRQAVPPEPSSPVPAAPAFAAHAKPRPEYSFAAEEGMSVGEAGEMFASCVTSSKQLFPSRQTYAISDDGMSPRRTCKYEKFPWQPVVVRDSTTYCVVFKPPFWRCCCCAAASNPSSFGYRSIVHFLRQFFTQRQAPALYSKALRYGVVYHLDESWSGFVLVAKTFEAFEAFANQLGERHIHIKFECLLSTDQNETSVHDCKFHCCRSSGHPTPPAPPQFRLCAPPQYERTYSSKAGRKLRYEPDQYDPGSSVEEEDSASWHHVVLACCVHPAPPALTAPSPFGEEKEFPELTALFWQKRQHVDSDKEGQSTHAKSYEWRTFCHGKYLSFYDCDAKGGASDTLTTAASTLSSNQKERFEIRPLCTFEAALPSDLKEILRHLQHVDGDPTVQQQPRQHARMSLAAFFSQPLSPEAKLKLLAGCIFMISVGMAPWRTEWGSLQRGVSKIFMQAVQGLGSLALCAAAVWRGLVCSGASLANQLQDARYYGIDVLWGASGDSLTDPAVAV